MKKYTRREIVGAVAFLVGFIAFFALIFTARMTMPLFCATVLTIAVAAFLAGAASRSAMMDSRVWVADY
jgi:hypothetical protein